MFKILKKLLHFYSYRISVVYHLCYDDVFGCIHKPPRQFIWLNLRVINNSPFTIQSILGYFGNLNFYFILFLYLYLNSKVSMFFIWKYECRIPTIGLSPKDENQEILLYNLGFILIAFLLHHAYVNFILKIAICFMIFTEIFNAKEIFY